MCNTATLSQTESDKKKISTGLNLIRGTADYALTEPVRLIPRDDIKCGHTKGNHYLCDAELNLPFSNSLSTLGELIDSLKQFIFLFVLYFHYIARRKRQS